MAAEPLKAVTDDVLMMLAPRERWGRAYLVRANMARMLERKVDSTLDIWWISTCEGSSLAEMYGPDRAPCEWANGLDQMTHVDIGKILAHDLLAGIVDKHIESTKLLQMLIHNLLDTLSLHQIESEAETLLAIGFDRLLDVLRTVSSVSHPTSLTRSGFRRPE